MKLTPQLISQAPVYVNPEKRLTLNLRDQQALFIENLDTTNNTYNVIDLTNNDIIELSGIPENLDKLETLLLANNNISRVKEVHNEHVRSLSLVNNNVTSLSQLEPLRHWKLEHLVLLGNKVVQEHNYRLFVVWLVPTLKVLDGEKVKASERAEAVELFGESYEKATPVLDAILSSGAKKPVETKSKQERLAENTVKKLSDEEKADLLRQLEEAESIEEVERISAVLKG
ncbi:hypothetical protein FT663_04550 [Candidozyma haemuli var. vulneris]|uniref:U2 small nuclear ribonucleoprotein A' n=1 Tax=Candidozyma haemuli TaxID=45357 RepID=A0A2V1B0E9_9ASCO|nr:hypothetical protein CXQ85_003784 [[Candida] haemuloni]KAF3986420.1 hypothetical protein FT662_04571 [[Candida] haemuloni var. vulneris]KAF3987198.1 hypothetical protein FT663_04550 [[Candida] haemuloni var. vulneris]PVH23494.1 hypothetical protein CXQ85_003784 [[Candida] haemuloni]